MNTITHPRFNPVACHSVGRPHQNPVQKIPGVSAVVVLLQEVNDSRCNLLVNN